jgi:glycosyltransferase involved in cell wall biosynthesis
MRICTIVARNYLAYARVLAESFLAQHPDGECSVLVIDDVAGEVDQAAEPFSVIHPSALGIERFEGMAAMYDVTELATAVKPWLLAHLLEQGDGTPVAYFDPDIRFYAPVEEIEGLVVEHGLVLIPHITAAIPDDGLQPDELALMASGTYNLGFVAMAPGARTQELLEWWQKRLRYDCVIDHALGYFVDQRWFDLVPSMFAGTAVLRDPGANVAYWNLHERTVARDSEGIWLVNGVPLRFFHFSGFDPGEPHLLSKHQTRTPLSSQPELAKLCAEFAQEVCAHRREGERAAVYGWGRLGDGRAWDRRLRRLYREGEREGAFRLSPFDPAGAQEFFDWLNETPLQDATPVPVSRFWLDVYRERNDLQVVFPKLTDEVDEFERWIEGYGHEAGDVRGLMPEGGRGVGGTAERRGDLITEGDRGDAAEGGRGGVPPEAASGLISSGSREPEAWGVNVAGFLQSELGIGEAARGLICGLDAAGVPLLPVHGSWRPSSRQGHAYTMFDTDDAAFPINIVCVNADVLPQWAAQAGEDFFSDRYTIGFWWWEVLAFPPEWLPAFDLVDEVWVATQHVADALMPVSSVPVTKVTMPISAPPVSSCSRHELGLPRGFLFLFLFDHHSIFERKNPLATIEAFGRAFRPGSGASLVIKSINHEHHPHAHERLLLAASEHPDVHVIDSYVTASEKNSMIASADCYVSLHRSEGFGLTPAEAMCMGKPVIATRYGGNLEFMNDRNSWLVDCELVPIGPGQEPYPADGEWADPDIEQAAGYMREVFAEPQRARRRAAQGARDMSGAFSPQAAGDSMRRRLEHIHARRERTRRDMPGSFPTPDLGRLAELVSQGPQPPGGPRSGSPRGFIRRLVLRLIKPFTAYQRMVDTEMLDALRELVQDAAVTRDALREDRLRDAKRAAAQLAELRRQSSRAEEQAGKLERLNDELAMQVAASVDNGAAQSSPADPELGRARIA